MTIEKHQKVSLMSRSGAARNKQKLKMARRWPTWPTGGNCPLAPPARHLPGPLRLPPRPGPSPGARPPRRLSAGLCRGSHPVRGFVGFIPSLRGQPPAPTGPRQHRGAARARPRPQEEAGRLPTWMSLFRILPTAGKEPSARCCWTIQPLAAASS